MYIVNDNIYNLKVQIFASLTIYIYITEYKSLLDYTKLMNSYIPTKKKENMKFNYLIE